MYQESRGRRPSTTMQIASESYTGLCSGWLNRTASYTYDAMGNIATITGPYKNKNSVQRTYTYDAQNQLLSEKIGSDTMSYTYDTAGNIRSITGPSVSKSFSYNDSGDWKDLLTSVTVNGTTRSITYEEENGVTIGNPLSYFNGTQYTLAWQNGRQLQSLSGGGKSATYTYGADGIRTSKTVTDSSGTTTYQYTTQNGQIARQSWSANGTAYQMDFIYDAAGRPLAMYYRSKAAGQTDFNGDSYYYETNQQGDVIGLYKITYNATTKALTATRVASYEYDAWGNVTYSTGTMANINPLKYRGYYHDAETGFYYLQSRYYDPAIGRFVNADGYASTGEGFLGYNMFAYCGNDPLNRADMTGASWAKIKSFFKRTWKNIRKTVGKAFGASASVVYQKTRKVNTKHILYLFTYEHVSSVTTVTSTKGNSGSVVSFYANGIAPDYYNSNAGMQVNIGDISINANLAIDDIRISVTTTSGDTSYQSSIRANATELKIGFESAIITKVDEHTFETEKFNYSMSGMLLYALYVAATTGDWRGVPATAMRG